MDTKVLSSGIRYTNLPEGYVRPESERPNLSEVSECKNVPVIDLACDDRSLIVQQVADACKNYGFFQVCVQTFLALNHLSLLYRCINALISHILVAYTGDKSRSAFRNSGKSLRSGERVF